MENTQSTETSTIVSNESTSKKPELVLITPSKVHKQKTGTTIYTPDQYDVPAAPAAPSVTTKETKKSKEHKPLIDRTEEMNVYQQGKDNDITNNYSPSERFLMGFAKGLGFDSPEMKRLKKEEEYNRLDKERKEFDKANKQIEDDEKLYQQNNQNEFQQQISKMKGYGKNGKNESLFANLEELKDFRDNKDKKLEEINQITDKKRKNYETRKYNKRLEELGFLEKNNFIENEEKRQKEHQKWLENKRQALIQKQKRREQALGKQKVKNVFQKTQKGANFVLGTVGRIIR